MAANTNASASVSGIPSASSAAPSSTTNEVKEKDSIWYFTSEQLASSPSRRHGISPDQELSFRQMTAYLIQEMGQRLQVSQLCINTAIVYMHRFYAFHSFTHFSRNGIASASLFLAAKVEEQPRKLEHVIKASQKCLGQPPTSTSDASYIEQAQDLVFNENVLLQTLGFDVAIDHPHTHVVKTCHLVKACKDLAQTSYFLASNSLHLTSMCLQYRPTVVACFCIYLACKWSRWEIPQSTEGKHWFHYVDKSVTMDLLKQLTDEFIAIYEKSPARLKSKLNSIKALAQGASSRVVSKDKKSQAEDWKMGDMLKIYHSSIPTDSSSNGSGGGMTMDQQVQQYQQQQQQEQQQQQQQLLQQQQRQQQQQQQLPPPPPAPQQSRRSESHSSHHRVHHSSTSHHHSKQILPPSEAGDHKSTIHKQPYPSVSRQQRDPSQPFTAPVTGHSSNKQMQPPVPPPVISSRPSSAQGRQPIAPVAQIPQRPPPQAHDPNYHKSSSRSNVAPTSQLIPPPTIPNHKIMSKTESTSSSRLVHKDPNGRPIDPNKISSNKIYPQTSAQNVGVDMTRSMLQQSVPQQQQPRPYNTQIPNNTQAPPSSIHPAPYSSRTSSISNSKYDQQLSVQMQQQQQQIIHQQHQKQQQQTLLESSYNQQQQQQQLNQPSATHQFSRQQTEETYSKQPSHMQQGDQMELCSPPKYSQYTTPQGFVPPSQNQQQTSKPSSIFSPEWNEKPAHQTSNNGGKVVGYKTSSRDSPKKSERTPKKDKNRSSSSSSSMIDVNSAMISRPTQNQPSLFGTNKQQQKQEQIPVIPPPYGAGYGGVKRPSSSMDHQIKIEEELMRDTKIRKLDSLPISPPASSSSTITTTASAVKTSSFSGGTVNGIETNPDLVSSLLKESLCTENKFSSSGFIKTEPLPIIKSEYQDTLQLFEPMMTTLPEQILQNPPAAIKEEQVISASIEAEDFPDSVKSEKKKKKDKHKHKEKDKSKDKEERKKHKKDKDRHKDRERASGVSESSEPVKIKISKDKLNLSASTDLSTGNAPIGFKIKIPKDRITGDLSGSVGGGGGNYDGSNASVGAPPLKIKISKDKIESYSSSELQSLSGTISGGVYQYHGNSGSSSTTGGGSSSSKKKDRDRDRDRDREKEKKRSSHDHSKMNGSSSLGNNGGGNAVGTSFSVSAATTAMTSVVNNSNSSSSKGQISNKIPQYTSTKMSHLFGESNDDDDDDDEGDNHSDDISTSPKLPPVSSSSSSHLKSTSSFHGRYSSSDNRYNSSSANLQQQFSQHRRPSSSSYQKNNR